MYDHICSVHLRSVFVRSELEVRTTYYRAIYLRMNSRDLLKEMSEQQGSLCK